MPSPSSTDVRIDQALTDLSIAYRQESPAASDIVFPIVRVTSQSGKYFVWDKADLWRNNARMRAPGDKFARIKLTLSNDSYSVDQYAEEYQIPDETARNAGGAVDLEETGTRVIMDNLLLAKDISFATNYMTTGVWGTDLTGVAAAPGAGQFLQWTDAASDPSGDVLTARRTVQQAVGSAMGIRFIGVTGQIVESALLNHPDAIDRIKYTQAATVNNVRQTLAAWLGLDQLVVVDRQYTTSGEGVTDAFSPVVDDDFLVVAVPTAPGLNVASPGYTFAWDDGNGDTYTETYRDESVKSDILRGITYYDLKLTVAAMGYFFSNAV